MKILTLFQGAGNSRPYHRFNWCHTLMAVVVISSLAGCKGLVLTKNVCFIVRDSTGKLVNTRVRYELQRESALTFSGSSNDYGFFMLSRKAISRGVPMDKQVMTIITPDKRVSIPLNPYTNVFDIYLDAPPVQVCDSNRVADMHYHVSMRTHNLYGQAFYHPGKEKSPPGNINWLKEYGKKLCVYDEGWRKVRMKPGRNDQRLQTLFNGTWVKSKEGANNLKDFSEATFPHMRDGQVFLGYNAISPFEHSVSNEPIKRKLSSAFKSGANIRWLEIMGFKEGRFSHWNNFNREYNAIREQDQELNNFQWSYLKVGDEFTEKLEKPLVINVVEGGHIFQDRYFPHFINYDLTDSSSRITRNIRDKLYEQMVKDEENPLRSAFDVQEAKRKEILQSDLPAEPKAKELSDNEQRKWELVDSVLMTELTENVAALKKMDIFMVAIGHLSYNGMVGHAPAIDVSQKPFLEWLVSNFLRRAYGTRVSNDRRYRTAYDGLFYRVPGVNYFGDAVITKLLNRGQGGRIQIDLKHSDPTTRKFILNRYADLSALAENEEEVLRPICSHCAVNGLSIDYASPMVNEYQLLKAAVVRKFYPFGMNLYDEEVMMICQRNGIIGIPLEERVLGGFIDTKIRWPHCIKQEGNRYRILHDRGEDEKRFAYTEKALRLVSQENATEWRDVITYYEKKLSADGIRYRPDMLLELACEEYLSAEPFLQNMFHVVDIAYMAGRHVKLDSAIQRIVPTLSEDRKTEVTVMMQKAGKVEDTGYDQGLLNEPIAQELKATSWDNICIGSDLDGLIDPIDICPTASHYPLFKEKLKMFIPLFLVMRHRFEPEDPFTGPHRSYEDYFEPPGAGFDVSAALDKVFYLNLKEFTKYIVNQRSQKL